MSLQDVLKDKVSPQIEQALAECLTGARIAERKANQYRQLAHGEVDDTVYEACRSMSRFYVSMHEFFMEEQRAIDALLGTDGRSGSPPPARDA